MIISKWKKGKYSIMSNDKYELLAQQLQALIEGEPDLIANLSNASAAINEALENINWAGFYLVKENMLVLGPFQGKPACIRIPFGKGVCGCVSYRSGSCTSSNHLRNPCTDSSTLCKPASR